MYDSATLWTVAHQAPLSMGFSWEEYWSGLPCPSPRYLPFLEMEPVSLMSPALTGRFFITSTTWEGQQQVESTSKFREFQYFLKKKSVISLDKKLSPQVRYYIQEGIWFKKKKQLKLSQILWLNRKLEGFPPSSFCWYFFFFFSVIHVSFLLSHIEHLWGFSELGCVLCPLALEFPPWVDFGSPCLASCSSLLLSAPYSCLFCLSMWWT